MNVSQKIEGSKANGAIFSWVFFITEIFTILLLGWLPLDYWRSFLFVFIGSLLGSMLVLKRYNQINSRKGVLTVSITLFLYSVVIAFVNVRWASG